MGTNLLSRFSHVGTHQGIENMNTALVQHTHNTSTRITHQHVKQIVATQNK